MKLAITIPAFNEEKSIPQVLKKIPSVIANIDDIIIIVINDGSSDQTKNVAKQAGADIIISNNVNKGLATTFKKGIERALKEGADIIVNLDADGQHDPTEIEALIQPILNHQADLVVGNREVYNSKKMKWGNKYGNLFGDWVIRKLTKSNIHDTSSGFRALSREAALRINVQFNHTYTHETIIQAIFKNLSVKNVTISENKREEGESKLIKGLFSHIRNSSAIIIRTILMYKPLKTLLILGIIIIFPGILLGLRVTYYYIIGQSVGMLHSLILTSILIICGFTVIILGFLGDLISNNRKIEEEILYYLKK